MPKDDPKLISMVVGILSVIGILSIIIAIRSNGIKKLQEWIIVSLIFGLGVAIGLSPWIIKNYTETHTVGMVLLNGSGGTYNPDFSQIHSPEKIAQIMKQMTESSISSSGQSMNEDL